MQGRLIKDGDVIAGALTGALGVYITIAASKWEIMGPEGPGPGFFPIGYGIGLVILSLILIVSRFRADRNVADSKPTDWEGFMRAGLTWLAFAGSAGLMSLVGFYVSFALMTFFLVLVVFRKPLKSALVTGVLAALGFYLVFDLALDVSMPSGVMGF